MAKSKIIWTDYTWNPIVGCSKCSPGCEHCYAERMAVRLAAMGVDKYRVVITDKKWNGKLFFDEKAMSEPLKWKKPRRIFVNSMGDTFHGKVKAGWYKDIYDTIKACPQHTFIILTKRADQLSESYELFQKFWIGDLPNVWLGVTVCNQDEDKNIRLLLQVPAAVRFVSIEPMLGEINLDDIIDEKTEFYEDHINALYCDVSPEDDLKYHGQTINWVICGGESGPKARPMNPDWVRNLRDQCKADGVPFMLKQWGEYGPVNGDNMVRMGKKAAGRLPDGEIWDQYPTQKIEHYK